MLVRRIWSDDGSAVGVATCFVIMPISTPKPLAEAYKDADHFVHVLQYLFKPALERSGYEVIPPTASGAEVIHASIIKNLEESDLVLCDITTLNPNVFFELGIRTALDRPAAIVRDSQTAQIPFDANSINSHTYTAPLALWTIESEIASLVRYIADIAIGTEERNALWRYFGITQRAKPAEIENPTEAKLELLLAQVGQLSKQVEGIRSSATYGTGGVGMPFTYAGGAVPTSVSYTPATSTIQMSSIPMQYTYPLTVAQSSAGQWPSGLMNPIPSRFNEFVELATSIAHSESASLTVAGYDATSDAVVLRPGWRLSDENVKKIDRVAGSQKVNFRLEEGR